MNTFRHMGGDMGQRDLARLRRLVVLATRALRANDLVSAIEHERVAHRLFVRIANNDDIARAHAQQLRTCAELLDKLAHDVDRKAADYAPITHAAQG